MKVFLASIVCLLCLGFILLPAFGRNDDGRYDNNPLKSWFNGLRNSQGTPCCDVTDGVKLEDPEWREDGDGSYSVHVNGQWMAVPPEAVLKEPNKVSYSVVWVYNGRILCFLPGSGT